MSKTFTPEKLKEWRVKRGMTQRAAGLWWGLAPKSAERTWRRWELGERRIPPPLAKRITGS